MNIGFDLDGIFVDKPPIIPKTILERLYKDRDNGGLHYRIPSSVEQRIRILSHYPIFRPALIKNVIALQNLAKSQKYSLFLISSRFGFLKKRTEALVKKHGFDGIFKKLYFNYPNEQPHLFKQRILKEINIDAFIDDDLSLLKFLARENPKVQFYWLNRSKNTKVLENLKAISDLKQITTYV